MSCGRGGAPGADGKCIQVEPRPHPDVNRIISFKAEKKAELRRCLASLQPMGLLGKSATCWPMGGTTRRGGSRVYLTLTRGSERARSGRTSTSMPDIHQSAVATFKKTDTRALRWNTLRTCGGRRGVMTSPTGHRWWRWRWRVQAGGAALTLLEQIWVEMTFNVTNSHDEFEMTPPPL